jgi:hypothetical protein
MKGETVTDLSFTEITNTINYTSRPVVIHFIQILALKCADLNIDAITSKFLLILCYFFLISSYCHIYIINRIR